MPLSGTSFTDQDYINDSWGESPDFRTAKEKPGMDEKASQDDDIEDSDTESSDSGTMSTTSDDAE